MKKVYILHHVRDEDKKGEDVKIIGIYSSEKVAKKIVKKYKKIKGFKDYPKFFYIDEYTIDKDQWIEGFGIQSIES